MCCQTSDEKNNLLARVFVGGYFLFKKRDLFEMSYFLRRRPYLNMYGVGCSSITFCKSIVSQARAIGLVSTKTLSEGDKRVDSLN